MKKTTLLTKSILILFLSLNVYNSYSQLRTGTNPLPSVMGNAYTFSQSTGTYANLTGSTSINNGALWQDPSAVISIGFNFSMYGNITVTSLDFNAGNGSVLSDGNSLVVLSPLGNADITDRGNNGGGPQSPITYKVDGSVGSRIFKMEWKNAGFDEEDLLNGTLTNYINMQLWLYEGTNKIEMHYGSNSITVPVFYSSATGPSISINKLNTPFDPYFLSGSPASASLVYTSNSLNAVPADGSIYTFTPASVGITENTTKPSSFYPNPVSNTANYQFYGAQLNNAQLKITDVLGKTILKNTAIKENKIKINCNEFPKGIYFYQLTEESILLDKGSFIVN